MEKYDSLSEAQRIAVILDIFNNHYYSLAITLSSGDVIFGDPTLNLGCEYLPYSKTYRDSDDYEISKQFEKPISDKIEIIFPDGSGTVYGHSYLVEIPVNLISRIQGIRSFINEGPECALRNSPNPLSTSIMEHNCKIIERSDLKQWDYFEEALSEKAISGRGITFEKLEFIYGDWDYFKEINEGIRTLGASALGFGGSIGWQKSNYNLALKKLYDKDNTHLGIIREDPEKQYCSLEGNQYYVYELKGTVESIPILIMEEALCYPKEYINYIQSELTVFGEMRQIPLHLNGKLFNFCLQARAIAHIPPQSNAS